MASRGTPTPNRRPAQREDGFTLPELLVSASVMLVAAAAVMTMMLVAFRQTDNQNDRVVALDDARNGLIRMQSEIRSASGLNSVSPQVLDVLVHFPEDPDNPYHWVRYKCIGNDHGSSSGLGGKCSRQDKTLHSGADCSGAGSGPGCVVVLRNVVKYGQSHFAEPCDNYAPGSNDEKHFCLKENRTVQLSIFVEVPGAQNPLELRGAVTVRNCLDNQEQVYPCVSSTPTA
jgi:prepilin-type N-terminal cleavage/methylation domain-containing protein